MPKFDIFNLHSTIQENITEDLKGSPLNHTEWSRVTSDMITFSERLKNISPIIKFNETVQEYVIKHYDDVIWSFDKLRKATPNVNWDKILMGFFGRTNITEKVLVLETNFANHINDLIKQVDKR